MTDFSLHMALFVRKKTKALSMTLDTNLMCSHFRLLDCYLHEYFPTEAKTPSAEEIAKLLDVNEQLDFLKDESATSVISNLLVR
eukprot:675340-Amphidinium_carterae.1